MGYDQWLEAPYQAQYESDEAFEYAEEKMLEDGAPYSEGLEEWLEENPTKTEEDFRQSDAYENIVWRYYEMLTRPDYD